MAGCIGFFIKKRNFSIGENIAKLLLGSTIIRPQDLLFSGWESEVLLYMFVDCLIFRSRFISSSLSFVVLEVVENW